MAYRFIWSLVDLTTHNEDELELDFRFAPNPGAIGFVWGIVAKDCLARAKKDRWDLTLTRTSENSSLGSQYCVMTG